MQPSQYRRRVLQRAVICLPTFDRPDGICDFVFQTARELSDENVVIILALGENWRGISHLLRWWRTLSQLQHCHSGQVVLGIFQFMPLQRFALSRNINLGVNIYFLQYFGLRKHRTFSKILWIFHPFESIVLPFFPKKSWHLHLDIVDWHTSGNAVRQHLIDMSRRLLLQRADSVSVISKAVQQRLAILFGKDAELVPQGFDATELLKKRRVVNVEQQLKRVKRSGRTLVGYFGGINQRLDLDLLEYLVKQKSNFTFLFVGPISEDDSVELLPSFTQRRQALLSAPNVKHLPRLPRESLLPLMQLCDALIIPYDLSSDFNSCSFPMKVMEYFVAGRPIVSVDIPSLRTFKHIAFGRSPSEFMTLLEKAVRHPLTESQQVAATETAFAQTWKAKLDSVDRYLARVIRSA